METPSRETGSFPELNRREESVKFLAVPKTPDASAIAARKRTTTLNSWHSTCDLNPDAVIRDEKDDDGGFGSRGVLPCQGGRGRGRDSTDKTLLSSPDEEDPLGSGATPSSPSLPLAPDGGWGWMCVFGCSLIHFILGGIGKSYGLIHVSLTESLEESDFAVSWIHALSVCCRMCMGPLASMLFAKGLSCRQIVMMGGFISMSMYFVSSLFVSSLSTLFVTMGLLVGFGNSLVYTPSILIVGQYFDRHKAMANGFAVMGTGLGALLMPVIIQVSLSSYGLSGALLILGGVSFHACVCGALYFPLLPRSSKKLEDTDKPLVQIIQEKGPDEKKKDDDIVQDQKIKANSWLLRFLHALKTFFKEGIDVTLFRDSTFWILTISQFLSPFAFMPNLYFLPKLALALWSSSSSSSSSIEELKVDAAFLISVNGIADIVGRALFGVITNYGFLKRHRAAVYAFCPFIYAIGSIMAPFIGGRGFPYLALCGAITGCFSGGFIALTPSILSDALGRERLSSSFALTLAIKGIGALLAAPLAGAIVSLTASRDPATMPYTGVYIFTTCSAIWMGLVLCAWQLRVLFSVRRDEGGSVEKC